MSSVLSSIPSDIRRLMRPGAAALAPYDPDFSAVDVNLSANENAFGLPSDVAQAVCEALTDLTYAGGADGPNRYPVPLADELRDEFAAWHGVNRDQVCVGNGGDELLFNLLLAFGGPARTLVSCPPTFSVYRLYAELTDTPLVEIPRDAFTFSIDEDALISAASTANLVIVCSPNNPTGTTVSRCSIESLCDACPGIVLVDEAYVEFSTSATSAVPLLAHHHNLVVLRTLSKAYALAGGRLGYILASSGVVAALTAVRQPYSVNAFTQAAALAVVRRREAFLPVVTQLISERERLYTALTDLGDFGVDTWPSEANFLLVRVPDAQYMRERLRDEYSVLVRSVSGERATNNCLRITVGTPEENDRLLAAFVQVLKA